MYTFMLTAVGIFLIVTTVCDVDRAISKPSPSLLLDCCLDTFILCCYIFILGGM